MHKIIKDISINYSSYGNKGAQAIVLLHGWGQNIDMMQPVGDLLKKDYHIILVDLPGFGNSEEPKAVYSVYDYVDTIKQLLDKLNISEPIMIGHSFGGKISLLYASLHKTKKLVVFGSPYDNSVKKMSMKTKVLKMVKHIPLIKKFEHVAKRHMGSVDYRSSTHIMRQVLTDTVNRSIVSELSKINCPTLIIWGSEDKAVPISEAYRLEKLIKNAAVIEYPYASHYAYLENLGQTSRVLKVFFTGKE